MKYKLWLDIDGGLSISPEPPSGSGPHAIAECDTFAPLFKLAESLRGCRILSAPIGPISFESVNIKTKHAC